MPREPVGFRSWDLLTSLDHRWSIHLAVGSGLAAAIVLGPRIGRFTTGRATIHGHDLAQSTFGALLLWFGWFGFNGGSTLAMSENVPRILINTNMAAATGGLSSLTLAWFLTRRADVGQAINGVLAGLVAITASCHLAEPHSAIAIGLVAGLLSVAGTYLLEYLKIDDVVGAVPSTDLVEPGARWLSPSLHHRLSQGEQ